ncbi:MAG: glycosyltransferase family 39 protein [bacterium]
MKINKDHRRFTLTTFVMVCILLFALTIRLIYLKSFHDDYFAIGLVCGEAELAKSLLEGKGLVIYPSEYCAQINKEQRLIDLEDFKGKVSGKPAPAFFDMPGYAYLLAFTWKIFGEKRFIYIQIIQVLMDVFCCYLLFKLAALLYGTGVGLLTAFIYATYLPLIRYTVAALRDIWVTFILIPLLYLVIREVVKNRGKISYSTYITVGILLGLEYYMRGSGMLLPVFLSAGIFLATGNLKNSLKSFAVMTLIIVIFMLPWVYRNYRLFGIFMPTRPVIGQGLWEGLGMVENPFGAVLNDGTAYERAVAEGFKGNYGTPEYNNFLMKKALGAIKEYPLIYLKAVAFRLANGTVLMSGGSWFFDLSVGLKKYSYITYKEKYGMTKLEFLRRHPLLCLWYAVFYYHAGIIFCMMVFGFFIVIKRWRMNLLLLSVPLSYLATTVPIHLEDRYVLVSTFPYLIFASLFIIYVLKIVFKTNIMVKNFY